MRKSLKLKKIQTTCAVVMTEHSTNINKKFYESFIKEFFIIYFETEKFLINNFCDFSGITKFEILTLKFSFE